MKAQCSRALKNFSSQDHNPDGALEEGTVAALIALSLEGKSNDTPDEDQVEAPTVVPLREAAYGPPANIDEVPTVEQSMWFAQLEPTPGGPAGPLVDTPDPPAPDAETPEQQARQLRSIGLNDSEGQTNMAFAKLSVPKTMVNKYTFADQDFNMVQASDNAHETQQPDVQNNKPQPPEQKDETHDPPAKMSDTHSRSQDTPEPPLSSSATYGSSFHQAGHPGSPSNGDTQASKGSRKMSNRKRARTNSKPAEYNLGTHAAELGLWTN